MCEICDRQLGSISLVWRHYYDAHLKTDVDAKCEKHGNYQYTVVKYCLIFMVVGAVLQFSAIRYVAGREKAYTDLASQRNMDLYNRMRQGARERALDTPQQQWRGIEKDSREAAQTPAN